MAFKPTVIHDFYGLDPLPAISWQEAEEKYPSRPIQREGRCRSTLGLSRCSRQKGHKDYHASYKCSRQLAEKKYPGARTINFVWDADDVIHDMTPEERRAAGCRRS